LKGRHTTSFDEHRKKRAARYAGKRTLASGNERMRKMMLLPMTRARRRMK
jgi:hypothetical protein